MTEVITEILEEKPKVIEINFENDLISEMEKYGALDASACINCGNCTAICGLTGEGEGDFPRKIIRYMQLGQKQEVLESTAPWLCYYCGECSATCPKGANPGEIMMASRRWAIGQYDSSGKAKKLFTSSKASWMTILIWSLFPLIGMLVIQAFGLFGAEIVTDSVQLNKFAPVYLIWIGTLVTGAYKGKFLVVGMYNMWKYIMGDIRTKIPLSLYVKEFKVMVIHMVTQNRWRKCGSANMRWFKHLLLVTAYATMFILIFLLLWWFQTDEIYPIYHPQRWLGYYATLIMIYTSIDILYGRMKKEAEIHKVSTPSDWMFPILILLVAVSGIMVHIFRYMELAWPTYTIYVIHLMITSAMLAVGVGVGKWSHIFYRPLAMYFDSVKKKFLAGEIAVSTGAE